MIVQPQFDFMEYYPASPQESRSIRRRNSDLGTRAGSDVQQDLGFLHFLSQNNSVAEYAGPTPILSAGARELR